MKNWSTLRRLYTVRIVRGYPTKLAGRGRGAGREGAGGGGVLSAFRNSQSPTLSCSAKTSIMGHLKSCVLRGQLDGKLTFPIGLVEDIKDGRWLMCFSTISFSYRKAVPARFLAVSSNFVTGFTVDSSNQLVSVDVTMNIIHVKGNPGTKGIVGFRQRDFFEVNNAQRDLTVRFTDASSGESVSGAEVIVHALLKRER